MADIYSAIASYVYVGSCAKTSLFKGFVICREAANSKYVIIAGLGTPITPSLAGKPRMLRN